jgi:hypothetical protein
MDRRIVRTTIFPQGKSLTNKQQRVLQALRRVLNFGNANPLLIPAQAGSSDTWSPLTRQLDTVNTLVTQVTDAAAQQSTQATNATLASTSEPSLRTTLRQQMHAVTQVAQSLKKTVPGIGVLKMPKGALQTESFLKSADSLTQQASTYQSVLVEHGLPADFVAQLTSATAALTSSVDGRGTARTARRAATKQVAVGLALGTQYVQIMDAALSQMLKADPAKLVQWKTAKRVTIKGVASTDTSSTASGTPAPTASSLVTPTPVTTPAPAEQPTAAQ